MPKWPKKEEMTKDVKDLEKVATPKRFHISEIKYERVFPIPNARFASERICLVAQLTEDDVPNLVIEQLKRIALRNATQGRADLEKARHILNNKNSQPFSEVVWAEAYLRTIGEDLC